ncbi:hypothetical protein NP233_g2968 [Leucocoprinus birnbaumii]|uniref:Cytochrome P450 n=1 Tax=Leucocoprinus birnbaumii TaxID=56174 RepID=A0AAD5VZ80_9AGAR|nr:hypothetical protein NP233_g2968 [Leucocoprinus birnbaumii]
MTYFPAENSIFAIYLLTAVFVLRVFYTYIQRQSDNPDGLPLPPGPKGLPFIGNILDIPLNKTWLAYDDLIKKYGDMVYLSVLGKGILILGSMERVSDIFEKRGNNYSDRPPMPMVNDLFLTDLIIRVTYGFGVDDWNDEYAQNIEEALGMLVEAATPGRYLVDFLPLMKYIPSWFPGAGWKQKAEHCRDLVAKAVDDPYERVQKQMNEGTAVPSICSQLIELLPDVSSPDRAKEEKLAKNVLAMAYLAGADTTVSVCSTFFLAMRMYPEVQRKAQAELDSVLQGRLPEFSDRSSLPYINAMAKETHRWQMVAPSGLYHSATSSDIYKGFYIPKGTLVIGNGWTILNDSENFTNPDEYIPERYLKDGKINPDVQDPSVAAFGYGKRKCPGQFFSEDSLFSIIAHVLTVYDIKPGLDDDGKEVKIMPEYSSGLSSHPGPFKCRIMPRSKAAEDLIRSTESSAS